MCRWIAYSGSPVHLDALLFNPAHSLVDQSRHAHRVQHVGSEHRQHSAFFINGDGIGVGWYGERNTPFLYRDVLPAWNDGTLQEIARSVQGRTLLAHVRASSGTAIQQTNCHPFRYKKWLFQHNGVVREFSRLRHSIDTEIDPMSTASMEGSTDSERLFYLALTFGLDVDPESGLQRMIHFVETLAVSLGVVAPVVMTAAASDGDRLCAVRYSSTGDEAPTLFHSRNLHAIREADSHADMMPDDAKIILSEPLDDVSEHWAEVPEGTFLEVMEGKVRQTAFNV